MSKKINFIILGINAFADYETRDIAGSMRIKNVFNPMLANDSISLSNLIVLDLFGIDHIGKTKSTVKGVDCLSIGYRSILYPLSVFRFLRAGMKFIKTHYKQNSANIIYNYQYPDIRNFLLLLYAKSKGYKIVFDFVEDIKHETVKTFNDRIRKWLAIFFIKLIPFYADAVFVISGHLMKATTKITGSRIPVFMLPISVDFNNISSYKAEKKDSDLPRIFYGGSFAQKDGLEYLLEAIDALAKNNYRFKLILSGKAEPDDVKRLFPKIINNHLIEYKGYLSTEEYFGLLNSVDICCMTRTNSAFANAGFPFKLGEFLGAGKLIIASRIGDVDKYLVHKESAYLITPESTTSIVEGLTFFLDNLDTLPQTIGTKARQVAEKYFDANISSSFMLEKCTAI